MTKMRYVLLPSDGMTVPESNPHQREFFQSLHYRAGEVHTLSTMAGGIMTGDSTTAVMTVGSTMEITVLDSIDEHKAKLIEIAPEDLPAFRGAHPSARLEPEVFYRPALVRYEVAAAALDVLTVTVTSSQDGASVPVPDAMVVAFTNFAGRSGAQGTTDAEGQVSLALGPGPHQIDRLYVYPKRQFWPALQRNLTLSNGSNITLLPIDLSYVDCVRHYYGGATLDSGRDLTVGVIDSGVATDHPDLAVQGGKNTVLGEQPADYGDNGTEGHGTHVAGIIAAHGTAPHGICGVAPGVTLP
jgi:Subtilase family